MRLEWVREKNERNGPSCGPHTHFVFLLLLFLLLLFFLPLLLLLLLPLLFHPISNYVFLHRNIKNNQNLRLHEPDSEPMIFPF